MRGEERKKRRVGERGGEVRLPHSKFLDPPLLVATLLLCAFITRPVPSLKCVDPFLTYSVCTVETLRYAVTLTFVLLTSNVCSVSTVM